MRIKARMQLHLAIGCLVIGGVYVAEAQTRLIQPSTAPTAQTPQQAVAPKPTAAALDAQIVKQLRLAIARCWKEAGGTPVAASPIAMVEFDLKRNGAIAGGPRLVNRRGQPTPVALAQSATRAILECAPYANLPPEAFEQGGWRRVRMSFDSRGL